MNKGIIKKSINQIVVKKVRPKSSKLGITPRLKMKASLLRG